MWTLMVANKAAPRCIRQAALDKLSTISIASCRPRKSLLVLREWSSNSRDAAGRPFRSKTSSSMTKSPSHADKPGTDAAVELNLKPPKHRPNRQAQMTELVMDAEEALMQTEAMKSYSKWQTLGKPFVFTIGTTAAAFAGAAIWRHEETPRALPKQRRTFFEPGASLLGPTHAEPENFACLNGIVYGAWLLLPRTAFMARYFVSSTYAAPFSLPLLLSSMSHKNLIHLAVNMYVLWNFGNILIDVPGMDKQNMCAFLAAGGVVSAYASHLLRIMRHFPSSSLGASGAICAAVAAVGMAFPETRLAVIGLTNYPFSIQSGLQAMVAIEAIGIWRKWRFFDHAGHLGGLLFGMWYVMYGQKYFDNYQAFVLRQYVKMRSGKGGGSSNSSTSLE